jgi:hypothetical protein
VVYAVDGGHVRHGIDIEVARGDRDQVSDVVIRSG